ncbi:unnamed protein product [Prunus armeniaca]
MIYTAIDTFYLTDEQVQSSPSRKDGMYEATETVYGYLKLIRFCFTDSIVRKKVAAGCLWLASKPEECPKKARQFIIVFHRMECRRENLPIEPLDPYSKDDTLSGTLAPMDTATEENLNDLVNVGEAMLKKPFRD